MIKQVNDMYIIASNLRELWERLEITARESIKRGVTWSINKFFAGIGGKHIEAKRAAAPPVRKGIDISGTDLLIIIRNIFIHSYNFLPVLNSFMIAAL